jgi:hypothetical protein
MSEQQELIEVGAADEDGTIDHWIAKESVRQGELLLANQIGLRTMYSISSTSILGWSVTISIGLVGWVILRLSGLVSNSAFSQEDIRLFITAIVTLSGAILA